MLAAKRHEKILEKLVQERSVSVSELSSLLKVTEKTIREDLEKLESQGMLRRIRGGAVITDDREASVLPNLWPNHKNSAEKSHIAKLALRNIEPGDIVAFDGGSTTLEIAKLLDNKPLTVVTNDVFIIGELARKDRIRLVVPGGQRNRNLLVGSEAVTAIRGMNIRKAFISATGIHLEYGLTIYTGALLEQKKVLMEIASQVFCVADHSKFEKCALLTFANLREVDKIITDPGLSDEIAMKYASRDVVIEK